MSRSSPLGPTPGSVADQFPDADPDAVARAIVLRKLAAAPRTRAQLADDLRRRNVPDEAAQRVLDRFTEVGLINDAAYAQAWVRSRHAGKGLSRRALHNELRERGVDLEIIERAVEQVDSDTERQTAAALVAKKLASMRDVPDDARQRRLVGLLARKGYPAAVAAAVVRETLAAHSLAQSRHDS